ncbi:two component sensor kinase for capsular biosynthesis [Bordetella trematum]|uniref:Two component sensor kinase for capsular biosynthesis n=1 Tax=Bordetella trematum TaxID=123899 RepID=A0A157PF65_9BORD|nr:two component sensor kinase for capsular biosynthesis [Bordetella trematum]SAI69558.1 two component sensor kinase for capsular biosynthesis [Bordetella trematum]SUV99199.1 two component sensor kinase for capsular biosynthesis [Bordetella trematum]
MEDSKWVIDCAAEGPSRPVAVGRLISISIFGLRGLMLSLEFALQRRELAMQARPRYRLGQALKVLVVEDHPVTRRLLEEQLTLLGCQVHAVPDGQQALQQLEREGCEVFMTDLSMPGMDGYELVRRVRQQHPWLPILVVTADVTPQQTRRFAHDTRIKVLGKPLALEALGRALSQISGVQPVVGEPQLSDDLLGGKPLPEELRQTFQTANEASLEAMREAWEKNDVPRLLAELHALRGALNVFGMEWLAKQSAELSQALKQGDMQSHQTRFARFCFDLQRTFSVQSAPEARADRPGRAAVG